MKKPVREDRVAGPNQPGGLERYILQDLKRQPQAVQDQARDLSRKERITMAEAYARLKG